MMQSLIFESHRKPCNAFQILKLDVCIKRKPYGDDCSRTEENCKWRILQDVSQSIGKNSRIMMNRSYGREFYSSTNNLG